MKVKESSFLVDTGLNMNVQFTCYKAILMLCVCVIVCVCVCLFVHVQYACTCVFMFICVRVHMHVEAHVGMHVFLDHSPSYTRLSQGLLLSLELTILNNVTR